MEDNYKYLGISPANGNLEEADGKSAQAKYFQRVRYVLRKCDEWKKQNQGKTIYAWPAIRYWAVIKKHPFFRSSEWLMAQGQQTSLCVCVTRVVERTSMQTTVVL